MKWIAANHKDLGADASKAFILGGVSSGATSSCTISHLWRDEGITPPLTGLYLSVPAPCIVSSLPEKYRSKEKAWDQNQNAPFFDREASNFLLSKLLATKSTLENPLNTLAEYVKPDPYDPLRSPLLFSTGHKNLPPTYFVIAGADPWRDVGLIYEEILREECGVKTKVDIFPGLPHGFWGIFSTAEFAKTHAQKSDEGLKWLLEQSRS
jgi:acetyl esterase/lipase